MKKDFFLALSILIASFFLSLPLIKPGLHQIHDDQQIARLYLFDQSLKSGQFPVRWVDELGFGFGYPLFVFYPPLVYMVSETFHLLGFGFIDSIKLTFAAGILLSGLAMYILVKYLFGRLPAFTAAMFYMFVPYRALDIYVRGALAESFSFVWLPLILWSFAKLAKTKKTLYIYLSAIFLSALMITHNLIFLPFILLLPFYLLFLIWKTSDRKMLAVQCLLSTILAFALSAFFWIPALAEKKFTIVDELLLVNLANYNIHFVYPRQLWNWAWGFGGSAAGLADGISFKIGKLHILASLAAFLLSFKLPTTNYLLPTIFFALLLLCAFMTTSYSSTIWQLIPPLGYLQFPWRFLTFTALFSSILAGAFIYYLRLPIFKLIAAIILLIVLAIPNYKLFKPQTYRTNLTDEIATSKEVINWDVSFSSFEYIPKGVPLVKSELGTNLPDIQKDDIPRQKIEILDGNATISALTSDPKKTTFLVDARQNSQIIANIFNFPGWQLEIDGQEKPIANTALKLISFNIPQGIHQVKIEFGNTPVRTVANLISLISILLILKMILWRKLKIS